MTDEGEAVKALEAAAEEWEAALTENAVNGDLSAVEEHIRRVIARWLESLLGDIPEEAVRLGQHTQMCTHRWDDEPIDAFLNRAFATGMASALRSLRSSLDGS